MYASKRAGGRSVLITGMVAALLGLSIAAPLRAQSTADVQNELETLKKRIEQLEEQLKAKAAADAQAKVDAEKAAADAKTSAAAAAQSAAEAKTVATAAPPAAAAAAPPEAAPAVDNQTPYAFGDFTWMNAVPRNHDEVIDSKYFTGEFRVDTNYIYDYWHPIDHTLGGTTEGVRTGEVVVQQVNVGGDFHAGGMQMRFLTQLGAVATATPRNDDSYSQGQWNLQDAYRYMTEAYAGYHFDVAHGLNIQSGIFMSYIGLFSYYSFDNWAYQPSYVSSNTPWFFTGVRAQYFPTNKLKIEPWFINGWQTYAKINGRHGVGGQILWRPTENLDFVFNTYTLGRDTLGNPYRSRYHEDDSMEWKYWENKDKLMHRMAFSLTIDFGCESGGGVSCMNGNANAPSQNFIGGMLYHRWWFDKDKFGATIGGGVVSNPGRYLVLLPPINGATATTGSPYFPESPGLSFRAYDFQGTFDWMPSQFVTFRAEFTQRGANVPYFTGPGGITPPGGPGSINTGDPTQIIPGWSPDLRKHENRWIFAMMVKL